MKTKDFKKYLKTKRKHEKETRKMLKEYADFDFGFLHELIVLKLRHMLDYYQKGNYVWQEEHSKNKIITELKETLKCIEDFENLEYLPLKRDDFETTELFLEHVFSIETQQANKYRDFYEKLGKYSKNWWD